MQSLDLDLLLQIASQITWVFFSVYVVTVTIRSAIRHGILRAGLELLTFRVLLPLMLPIVMSLISMSVVFVHPQQVGVVVSIMLPGGVRPEAMPAGLHFIIPLIEYEVIYPISWQTYTMSSKVGEGNVLGDDSIRARTSDGQEVLIDTSVIFRIDREQAVTLYIDWQERYIEDFMRPVLRGYVRRQVSQFTVEEVNSSSRRDLEALLDRLLLDEFEDKGLVLDQFLLRDIAFSPEYALAVEKKQVALEGQQQTLYEAQQAINIATGNASAIEIEANGRATAIKLEAEAEAEALKLIAAALETNDQLLTYAYIEQLAPNIDVMLLPNDAPFLFPLPDLKQNDVVTQTITTTVEETLEIVPPPFLTPVPENAIKE
ncbi:MAG: prohibitin family protein [Candidatus Promineifilaceae bacterium]